jgi:hypothetical protein
MADFRENRGATRSPRTIEAYETLWRVHLLPSLGHLRISEITTEIVRRFKREIPEKVLERRPEAKGGGRPAANRALQQLEAALGFAHRMDWIARNPASSHFVQRFEESRAEDFLDDKGYAAVGEVLRDLEKRLANGESSPLSLRTLYALRVAIYTGSATALSCCGPVSTGAISIAASPALESHGPKETAPREVGDRSSWDPKPCGCSKRYLGAKAPST